MSEGPDRQLAIDLPGGRLTLPHCSPGLREALGVLAGGWASEDRLSDVVLAADGTVGLAQWYYYLRALREGGAICYAVCHDGGTVACLTPSTPDFSPEWTVRAPDTRLRLSRFAYLRREGDGLILESPLAPAHVDLRDARAVALTAALCRPSVVAALAGAVPDLPFAVTAGLVALLDAAAMLSVVDADGHAAEDQDARLLPWEFADLLFHAHRRLGRHDRPAGATLRLRHHLAPLPAVKPAMSGELTPLYVPDLEALKARDVPLARVLDERRSIRSYAATPLTAAALGEFLYRVARVTKVTEPDGERLTYQTSARPYPSGGACYPLELYLAVARCVGITPGLYHYDPVGHRLEALRGREKHAHQLLEGYRASGGLSDAPQVLVVIAARFPRVTWVYQSIGYALILKEVGVLLETMYLVATAMRLAPCALGAGDAELFARALGTEFYEETSVGEFLLGSDPTDAS